MGLLDSLAGMATDALSANAGGNPLLQGVLGLIQNQEGGLAGLVQQFQSKGLGEIAASWVGTGANLPVSADQLQGVLGNETVQKLAAQMGLSTDQLSGQLTSLLPQVVDKLTPQGQVTDGGFDANAAMGLLQGFFKG